MDLHNLPQSISIGSEWMSSIWLERADCRLLRCCGEVFTYPGDVVDGVLQDMKRKKQKRKRKKKRAVSETKKVSVKNKKRERKKK